MSIVSCVYFLVSCVMPNMKYGILIISSFWLLRNLLLVSSIKCLVSSPPPLHPTPSLYLYIPYIYSRNKKYLLSFSNKYIWVNKWCRIWIYNLHLYHLLLNLYFVYIYTGSYSHKGVHRGAVPPTRPVGGGVAAP